MSRYEPPSHVSGLGPLKSNLSVRKLRLRGGRNLLQAPQLVSSGAGTRIWASLPRVGDRRPHRLAAWELLADKHTPQARLPCASSRPVPRGSQGCTLLPVKPGAEARSQPCARRGPGQHHWDAGHGCTTILLQLQRLSLQTQRSHPPTGASRGPAGLQPASPRAPAFDSATVTRFPSAGVGGADPILKGWSGASWLPRLGDLGGGKL